MKERLRATKFFKNRLVALILLEIIFIISANFKNID
jgi:hypothetical protein